MLRSRIVGGAWAVAAGAWAMLGCRQNLLGTSQSVNQITIGSLESPAGGQEGFLAALGNFTNAVGGDLQQSLFAAAGLLSDELESQAVYEPSPVDARYTSYADMVATGLLNQESGDSPFQQLLFARSQLLLLVGPLNSSEQGQSKSLAGEAYALAGYAELYMAEDYCAGVTLDQAMPRGGVAFGTPLTTDSLLGTAIGHFDSALTYAYQNDTVIYLASIGKGRAWLDRGKLSNADSAVRSVPINFVYNLTSGPASNSSPLHSNLWLQQGYGGGRGEAPYWIVSNSEGGVGMNYLAADDGRLAVVNGGYTLDHEETTGRGFYCRVYLLCSIFPDSIFWYPVKFGPLGQSVNLPIATGVEAALIQAEADLATNGAGAWATDLNALRAEAPGTYLQLDSGIHALSADSTTGATLAQQVAVMFRERAFWLYGTGTRLGDMRREVRQYGVTLAGSAASAINLVYPNGPWGPATWSPAYNQAEAPYAFAWQNYGNDVDLALPTQASTGQIITNPAYKGCIVLTTVP